MAVLTAANQLTLFRLMLVPGLVILGVVLLVNEVTRRSDERVQAAVDRVTMEVGRLVALGRSLATASTMDGLRDALRRNLPEFAHIGGVWALIRIGGKWEAVAGGLPGTSHRASFMFEALADRVL